MIIIRLPNRLAALAIIVVATQLAPSLAAADPRAPRIGDPGSIFDHTKFGSGSV